MLLEEYRKRLDKITSQLEAEGTPEQDIKATVEDFKSIYDPDARLDTQAFDDWYQAARINTDLPERPDDPANRFYNFRAAFRSNAAPNKNGVFPEKFKLEGAPDLIKNGVDVRTNKPPDWDTFLNPTPYFEEFQQTAFAPKRNAQMTAAPTATEEVPVEDVRLQQMQVRQPPALAQPEIAPRPRPTPEEFAKLPPAEQFDVYARAYGGVQPAMPEEPKKQPEIMEPAQVKPAGEFGPGAGVSALKMDLKQMVSSNIKGITRSVGGELAEPNLVMFNRGKQLVESKTKPVSPEDKLAVQHYTLHKRGKDWDTAVEPAKKAVMDYADEIEKSIPEKDRQTVNEAQQWLTSRDAVLPENYGRTAAAIGIVSAANASSNVMALAGMVPVLGTPAAAAGAASLVNRERESWITNAKAAGLDDEKLQETFGNFYAVPSGVIEYGSSAVMVGPVKLLKKSKKFLPFLEKTTAQAAKKGILKSAIGQVLGAAGAVATEGTEEFTQQELQDGVLWWALTEAAKKNPEKVDQYIAQRDKINLPQTTTDAWKSFIVGAAAAIPVTILSRLVGGVGGKIRGTEVSEQTAPVSEKPVPVSPEPTAVSEKQPVVSPETANVPSPSIEQKTQFTPVPATAPGQATAIPAPEAETIKMPIVPGNQQVVKKSEGITQTYVPKEQGSIIPPQTTEAENVRQEEGKQGRLQVKPPPLEEGQREGLLGDLGFGTKDKNNTDIAEMQKEVDTKALPSGSVGVIDLTNLGKLNRVVGHDNADVVFKEVISILNKHLDPLNTNETAILKNRTGGDELTIIGKNIPGSELSAALKSARDEIDGYVASKDVEYNGKKIKLADLGHEKHDNLVTGSMTIDPGVADITEGKTVKEAEKLADDRSYTEAFKRRRTAAEKSLAKGAEFVYNKDTGTFQQTAGLVGKIINEKIADKTWDAKTSHEELVRLANQEIDKGVNYERVGPKLEEARRDNEGTGNQGIRTETTSQTPAPTQAATTSAQEVAPKEQGRPDGIAPTKEESRTSKTVPTIPTEEKKAPQQPSAPKPSAKKEVNSIVKLVVDAQKEQKSAVAKAKGKLPKSVSKRIVVKSSKTPPGSAKKLMNDKGDWEAAVWYNPEGKVVEVHINENLPFDMYAEALYHEIPGHIGQRLVFADSPAILNTMRQMYGAAKTRKDVDLEAIRKAYKSDIDNAGERGDDVLFEEWTAHNLHRYLIENDKANLPTRIYNLFRSALVKIGVVKGNIDDVLRSMVKKMKKAKDIGVLERGVKESFKRPVEGEENVGPVGQGGPVGQNKKATVKSIVEGEATPDEVTLDIPPETRYQAFRRIVTDRQYRLFKLMKGAEEKTGKELPDELNAYVMNDIFNSKAEARIKEFRETYIEPIEKLMVKNGLDVETVDQYNYAKHAEEANRVVGERRPDMVKAGKPPSGMSNEKAQQILNDAKASGKQPALEEISGIIQKWNKARLDLRVEYGLMTEKQRDDLLKEFEFYVPLKGVHEKVEGKDEVEEEIIPRVGKGLNVPRRNFYMRKGRETEAKDILANLIKDSADTVMIGEKNVIDNALYKFAKEFKNDLIIAEPVVYEKYFDEKSGIFKERKKTNFTIDDMTKYGLPLNFKVDGEPMQLLIKDKLLMKGLANAGAQSSENITKLLTKGILPVMRYLSIVRTQLAVNFPISNFMRDAMTGQLNTLGLTLPDEQKKGLVRDIMKDVLPAVGWSYQGLSGQKTEGAKKFNEFLKSGGAVSFLEFKDAATLQKELINRINLMGPGVSKIPQKLLRNAYEYITTLNGSVENAYRLATYQQLTKGNKKTGRQPLSAQKAAHIAKNITVNFNKKGELGPYLNAWAIFANANIQGSVRILNTLVHSKTVRGIAAGIIATSFGMAELMRYIAGDDPDDRENYYDKINDYTKDTHIVIPLGNLEKSEHKAAIRLPLAYGYNIFWAAGQILNKMAHTEDKAKAIPQAVLRMAGVIVDAFNPIGQSVVPTLMQPYFDIETNKDFMGAPVYKESKTGFGPQPTFSHSSLKKTPEIMQEITETASKLTGGGKYTKGAFDALGKYSSPDVMNYLFNFATGGVGKLGSDLASLPYEWISNKEVPIKRIPVAQRFYTEINEYQDVKKLYDNLDKARRVYLDYKEYKESDPKRAKKMEYEYPAILSMMRKTEVERTNKDMEERKSKIIPLNDRIIKPLKRMNEIKKQYEEKDNKEGVKRIEKLIINHSQTWNKRLDKMLNPPNVKPEKK